MRQCRFVSIARSSFYDEGTGESPLHLRLMRSIDTQFLETPFYGSRQMQRWLRRQGDTVSRKRVRRLLRLLGLHAVFQRPRTSQSHPGNPWSSTRSCQMAMALRPRPNASTVSSRYSSQVLARGARPGGASPAGSVDTCAVVAGFGAGGSVDTSGVVAGFQVSIDGRFWVSTEVNRQASRK